MIGVFDTQKQDFENKTKDYLRSRFEKEDFSLKPYVQQIEYSLLNFGKTARPLLIHSLARFYGEPNFSQNDFSWALAVEMIHCYSLIHDDLPCMDNSGYRRNEPSHHRKFGESDALLIGSSLQFEAFNVVSQFYSDSVSKQLCQLLSQHCGFSGLVGGQLLDLSGCSDKQKVAALKTGALFKAAALGSGIICNLEPLELRRLAQVMDLFGLWFQAMDDEVDAESWDNLEELDSSLQKSFSSLRCKEVFEEYLEYLRTQFWFEKKGLSS